MSGQNLRNKSVDNVKQYAISKMIGQLDTKREFNKISAQVQRRKYAEEQVQKRYADAKEIILSNR